MLKNFKALVENQTGRKIKKLLIMVLNSVGKSQHNGVAKHINRTLL